MELELLLVFSNQLLVEHISRFLHFNDLKNFRRVSQALHQIVTPLLSNNMPSRHQCVFQIYTQSAPDDKTLPRVVSMALDPRLLRSVRIYAGLLSTGGFRLDIKNINSFLAKYNAFVEDFEPMYYFLQKHHQVIQELQIYAGAEFAEEFLQILNTFQFPELRTISITEFDGMNRRPSQLKNSIIPSSNTTTKLFVRKENFVLKKLSKIHFGLDKNMMYYRDTKSFENVVQQLVGKAGGNLVELTITDHITHHLDLVVSCNLRKLNIRGLSYQIMRGLGYYQYSPPHYLDYYNMRMNHINKTLSQVKDSLMVLDIVAADNQDNSNYYYSSATHGGGGPFVPEMKNLTHLRITTFDLEQIKNFFNIKCFPKLKIFALYGMEQQQKVKNVNDDDDDDVDDISSILTFLSSNLVKLASVEELELHGMKKNKNQNQCLGKAGQIFPKIRNCVLTVLESSEGIFDSIVAKRPKRHTFGGGLFENAFTPLFASFEMWAKHIQTIQITFKCQCDLEEILQAVNNSVLMMMIMSSAEGTLRRSIKFRLERVTEHDRTYYDHLIQTNEEIREILVRLKKSSLAKFEILCGHTTHAKFYSFQEFTELYKLELSGRA